MSDPLERLRATQPIAVPDVGAIKARARGIERRRRVVAAASASAVAIVAVVGALVFSGGPNRSSERMAQPSLIAPSVQPGTAAAMTEASREAAVKSAAGASAAGPPAPTTAHNAPFTSLAAGSAASTQQSVRLTATLEVKEMLHGADFTLKVCNPGDRSVERSFNTSQRYDFEAKRGDELVWRWSNGRAFGEVVGKERWGPGECKKWTEHWDGTSSSGGVAPSGSYEAIGILKSSPDQQTKPKRLCLDIC